MTDSFGKDILVCEGLFSFGKDIPNFKCHFSFLTLRWYLEHDLLVKYGM
jgi:hypothetical protein